MSGISFFSDEEDTDNETAIEELISQAKDLSALEQISAINCSAFTDLPSDLDTRFRRLKSVGPISEHASITVPSKLNSFPQSPFSNKDPDSDVSDCENGIFSPSKQATDNQKKKKKKRSLISDLEPKSVSGSISIPSKLDSFLNPNPRNAIFIKDPDSSDFDSENGIFSPSKGTLENETTKRKKGLGPKSASRSIESPSKSNFSTESVILSGSEQNPEGKYVKKSKPGRIYSASSSRSPSPPAKSGCFLCSPKRVLKTKSPKTHEMGFSDDEILADLSVFSRKERNRILKNATEEEEKINREADKIVKWAKQASARMNVHSYEEDDDDHHIFK